MSVSLLRCIQSCSDFIGRYRTTLTSDECFHIAARDLTRAKNTSVARYRPMKSPDFWTLHYLSEIRILLKVISCLIMKLDKCAQKHSSIFEGILSWTGNYPLMTFGPILKYNLYISHIEIQCNLNQLKHYKWNHIFGHIDLQVQGFCFFSPTILVPNIDPCYQIWSKLVKVCEC